MLDVLIVGGSFAGLSAALQLGRARRRVLVLDTGERRNRFAAHAHGIIGHDGRSPGEIIDLARRDIERYETISIRDARASGAEARDGGFAVALEGGEVIEARRLVLAYGISDRLPEIPGMSECWGISLLHCPYCHGFEVADRRLGIFYASPLSIHATALLPDWSGDVTLFSNGAEINDIERKKIARRGVKLVETPVRELLHTEGRLGALRLEDGKQVELDALFFHPQTRPASDLDMALGCERLDGAYGPYLRVDERQKTTVDGVFAAGDLARQGGNLLFAMAGGSMAGIAAHQSLTE